MLHAETTSTVQAAPHTRSACTARMHARTATHAHMQCVHHPRARTARAHAGYASRTHTVHTRSARSPRTTHAPKRPHSRAVQKKTTARARTRHARAHTAPRARALTHPPLLLLTQRTGALAKSPRCAASGPGRAEPNRTQAIRAAPLRPPPRPPAASSRPPLALPPALWLCPRFRPHPQHCSKFPLVDLRGRDAAPPSYWRKGNGGCRRGRGSASVPPHPPSPPGSEESGARCGCPPRSLTAPRRYGPQGPGCTHTHIHRQPGGLRLNGGTAEKRQKEPFSPRYFPSGHLLSDPD